MWNNYSAYGSSVFVGNGALTERRKFMATKEMILVDEVDNAEVLCSLFHAMYAELPEPKPKKKK